MSSLEIQSAALQLPEREREKLVVALLESLPDAGSISDQEVIHREQALESGEVRELTELELIEGVRASRTA